MRREDSVVEAAMRNEVTEGTLYRIRGEFLEMPGLRLTTEQASRLWQMDLAACAMALRQLVSERFLTKTGKGAFVRLDQV